MAVFTATRDINAPADVVFASVAHIDEFQKAVPDIIDVEFLSDQHAGPGTRFVETRKIGRKVGRTELEVTEYLPGERVRFVAEAGGTTWDTIYTIEAGADVVSVTMVMTATAHSVRARVFNKLIASTVGKAIERDLESVKQYCETARP